MSGAEPNKRRKEDQDPVLDDITLRNLSMKIGSEWETLATYLEISANHIFRLKQDHLMVEDQIFNMLIAWRQAQTTQQIQTLGRALDKAGRVDLAQGVEFALVLSDTVLRALSTKLGSEWEELATYLQSTREEIHRTKVNYSTVGNRIFNLLVTWRQRQPVGTNVKETLATALRSCGRKDLGDLLMECSPEAWLLPFVFDVNLCRRQLSQFYKDEKGSVCIVPYDYEGAMEIDEIYVELELLPENTNSRNRIKLGSYDDLVTLPKKKVLVRGGPGSGKTTLVSKISHDWSANINDVTGHNIENTPVMARFKLLLALNMRELTPGMSLSEAILDQLLPTDTVISSEGLEAYIKDHQQDILLILDGYDEFISKLSDGTSKGFKRKKANNDEIINVLCASKITESYLIVTSRPHRVSEFGKVVQKYSNVELTGFAKENIKKYIWKFFKVDDSDSSEEGKDNRANIEKLVTEIEGNSALNNLAKTPVILALLCILWQDSRQLPKRVTLLYEEAMTLFVKHWLEKKRKEDDDEDDENDPPTDEEVKEIAEELLMGLGKVALDGVFEDKLLFNTKVFNKDVLGKACQAGILSKEKVRSKSSMVQQVSFVHKTFQEMCGGKFLADLFAKDPAAFDTYLQQISNDNIGTLEYLLRFCCGLSEEAAKLIMPKVVSLSHDLMVKVGEDCRLAYDDSKQDPWRLALLLLFESQHPEYYHFLKQLFERSKLRIRFHNAEVLVAVNYFIDNLPAAEQDEYHMLAEVTETELVGIRAQDVDVASKLICSMHAVKQLKLVFLSRSEYAEMEKLGKSISQLPCLATLALEGRDCDTSGIIGRLAANANSSKAIKEFSCHLSKFSIDAMVTFISRQPSLVTLKLLDNRLSEEEIKRLLEGIQEAKLEVLEIFWNQIGNSGKFMRAFLPTLRSLYLSNTSMEPGDWDEVFEDMDKAIHLEKLDLTWNKIGEAVVKLADSGTALSNLRILTLRKGHLVIGKEDITKISQWIGHLVKLEDLDLSDNNIGAASDEFPDELGKLTCLTRLNLSSTELKESAFNGIGAALKNMPNLQQLHLSENDIGSAMVDVAEGLKGLSKLTWLNLEDCAMNSNGLIAVSGAFEGMPVLTNLYLHGNPDVEAPGVNALFLNLHHLKKLECLEMRGLEVDYEACSRIVKECFDELKWRQWASAQTGGRKEVVLDKLNAENVKKVVSVVERSTR